MGILDRLFSSPDPFISDGGMETDLIFHEGAEMPLFASFVLLDSPEGCEMLRRYAVSYFDLAQVASRGFVMGTPTWRANGGWGPKLGLDDAGIRDVNRRAIAFARDLRSAHPWRDHILIEGVLGPAGDGYAPEQLLTPTEAARLHSAQLETFAEEDVDIASAFTITHPGEAIGMVNRARDLGLPFALSFTVETDGRLPTGQDLDCALDEVEAATGGYVRYYGINCAHPEHFGEQLPSRWLNRIGVVRPNASRRSHAELDEATELDDGDPQEFGALYAEMAEKLPRLRVVGGCCGSDMRHIKALIAAGV
ncbi:homocysteine S-methyltransferase [Sinorhizobium medicae]|uniref:Homocysteine S-methyltransferase n=2 Tax=Sinorhizobium medicae TaxID=110321 RepID=A6UMQ0_SINMW|nr:homocysteine S-methyltransferase family protein [Sinorhizobium medicae]ABR64930.1 homocysteine S-methyltransferase [Sinorhizobium medicae WSM419]MDX0451331.1 homocysteine S-methyltransferase [Sinorhizobium medicae]MDX0753274.1 homocysteine S-methyltransferase [Sinorhizobium medicae]MDX1060032.1 homocysteine S-methyltransferase [Sinorhizobium medicae]PLT96099.1 homocysteine S-methyltransferase [Sinorhizobium medicae]